MIIDPNNPNDSGPEQPEAPQKPILPPWRTFVVKFSDGRDDENIACHQVVVEAGGYVGFNEVAFMDAEETRPGIYMRRLLANVIDVMEVAIVKPGAKEN